ncbi:MAG: amidase family protein, partial [Acidimicrobiales bacterium]
FENGQKVIELIRFTTVMNLLGLPSVAVPVGISDGLPQGVQVVGGRYREDLCLNAGEAIESALGRITPIDPVD